MRSRTLFAVGFCALVFLSACAAPEDEATVIAFGADATTTTAADLRLEYTEFPELNPDEAALCEWIRLANDQTEVIAKFDRSTDASFVGRLSSPNLSDPVREGTERDYRVALNNLQIEGYSIIAGGADAALTEDQRTHLQTALPLVDALTEFNATLNRPETLLELQEGNVVESVTTRQASTIPPLVSKLDEAVTAFNEWAWSNCREGGLKMVWDDFIPHESLKS